MRPLESDALIWQEMRSKDITKEVGSEKLKSRQTSSIIAKVSAFGSGASNVVH